MNKLRIIIAMLIFGTIGVFVERLSYPSAFIALFRAICGTLVLLIYTVLSREKIKIKNIFANMLLLLPSGVFLGLNWVFLFEAYRYTSVPFATLCYYMAPVFVILLSPIFLKHRHSATKNACAAVAVAGMVLLTGVQFFGHWYGIMFGLGAALLYALIIILNSKVKRASAIEITVFQLGVSALVLLPYVLYKYDLKALDFDTESVILLLILGIVHTGIAYMLYFGAVNKLSPHTVAVCGYIDPVFAIIISSVMSRTMLSVPEVIGAAMILGSAMIADSKS